MFLGFREFLGFFYFILIIASTSKAVDIVNKETGHIVMFLKIKSVKSFSESEGRLVYRYVGMQLGARKCLGFMNF